MVTHASEAASPGRAAAWAALIMVAAATATYLTHGHTLSYGFHYDDYHFVRPYQADEVRAAFHGPWDSAGIERPFYRPLTVAFYAARFEWLGIDADAHHVLSLALFAGAAAMLGGLTWRLTVRPAAGMLATLFFVSHPSMPYALVAWITNQMHLLATLIVLAALSWWHVCRTRTLASWLPLLPAAAAAFMVKEDGIMLLPAIVAFHALRRRLLDPALQPVPRWFLAAAVLTVAALVLLRSSALQDAPGAFGPLDPATAWSNFWIGLDRVARLVPADRPWQAAASAFATLLPLGALLARKRASAEARYCMAAGAAMALLFNLPFVFITKAEQMHLVTTGMVLLLTGSAVALWEAARPSVARAALAVALVTGLMAFVAVTRHISTDFAPFGPVVLSADTIVSGWASVPAELRNYLEEKRQAGAVRRVPANPAAAVPLVAFGLRPWENGPDGTRYRWMSGSRVDILVAADAGELTIPIRHEAGAFGEAAGVRIAANGRPADRLLLEDGNWRTSRLPLRREDVPRARRMHRIVIAIDRAWVPAEIIPGSTDTRTLGLQIGEMRVR